MPIWPIVAEGAISSLEIQPPYRTPVRVVVPMEEREARANRFVSHLVGRTESERPSPSSSREHPSLLVAQRIHQAVEQEFREALGL